MGGISGTTPSNHDLWRVVRVRVSHLYVEQPKKRATLTTTVELRTDHRSLNLDCARRTFSRWQFDALVVEAIARSQPA